MLYYRLSEALQRPDAGAACPGAGRGAPGPEALFMGIVHWHWQTRNLFANANAIGIGKRNFLLSIGKRGTCLPMDNLRFERAPVELGSGSSFYGDL